jgi:hypothetical protein
LGAASGSAGAGAASLSVIRPVSALFQMVPGLYKARQTRREAEADQDA